MNWRAACPPTATSLAQAVKDGFLVDFLTVESKLKFLEEGISYADLPEEEKAEYEATFTDENGSCPERIESSALNEWLFNEDTIRLALNLLMTNGLKIDYGEKLGKTIIFAKNHRHAEKNSGGLRQRVSTPARLCQGHRQLHDLRPERHRRIL